MFQHLNLPQFISEHVTGRPESFFAPDLRVHAHTLAERIDGRSVLVIGGAGSIGSSYIKALLQFKPARLYVIDTNENGLTELVRDLRSSLDYHIPKDFLTYPLDFGDPLFEKIMRREGPFEIVANFAAHKHVRSEKDHYSIEAMVQNNVFKARHLLDLLLEMPPERFFCVSTDKAANPVNVMGASKKLMEAVILSYARAIPIATARFANVAFSNGSLPFGFIERLMKKQPFSAPLDVERYFVSPEESGQLCLLACMLGNSGDIFFPKLDPQRDLKKFSDIGTALLRTLGWEPEYCQSEQEAREKAANLSIDSKTYPVYYFASDTSGEKPYEEFYTDAETRDMTRFESIGVIPNHSPALDRETMTAMFDSLQALFRQEQTDKSEIVRLLQRWAPGFAHTETGKNLDQKM